MQFNNYIEIYFKVKLFSWHYYKVQICLSVIKGVMKVSKYSWSAIQMDHQYS